jgi:hypothetical protein
MKEVIHRVRKAIIDKLNGSPNVTNLTEFKNRVENSGGTLESFICLSNQLTPIQVYDQIKLRDTYIPIYNRIPSNATYPFVRVYSVSNDEVDQNRTSYITETITRLEVITRFSSDSGGELDSNLITDEILKKVRTRSDDYIDLEAEGFKVFTSTVAGINYLTEDSDDFTYFRTIIELSNRIEQIPPTGGLQAELQSELQT